MKLCLARIPWQSLSLLQEKACQRSEHFHHKWRIPLWQRGWEELIGTKNHSPARWSMDSQFCHASPLLHFECHWAEVRHFATVWVRLARAYRRSSTGAAWSALNCGGTKREKGRDSDREREQRRRGEIERMARQEGCYERTTSSPENVVGDEPKKSEREIRTKRKGREKDGAPTCNVLIRDLFTYLFFLWWGEISKLPLTK